MHERVSFSLVWRRIHERVAEWTIEQSALLRSLTIYSILWGGGGGSVFLASDAELLDQQMHETLKTTVN